VRTARHRAPLAAARVDLIAFRNAGVIAPGPR
jgi:hypothetical protein